ncbi:HPP family protein [Ruegeria denitrificans]|uniref:HPP family protein n=1 Tax=Ruegeria denitrificans TaxID=1715692 RepID=A0A0P1IKE1_9RHOB|nr:HPP family protein [Ruegeria denitrificans]CUK19625.1 HPP family protein [Ruegeria denitrificans]
MKDFFKRSQSAIPAGKAALAGVGGAVAIAIAGLPAELTNVPLLMAPFGASCVLLFSAATSPFSQPANVIFGHALSALIGLVMLALLPATWWAAAIAVGLAIGLMAALRVTHPPAGANPLVIFVAQPGFDFLLFPVTAGAVLLVLVAIAFHRMNGVAYPAK